MSVCYDALLRLVPELFLLNHCCYFHCPRVFLVLSCPADTAARAVINMADLEGLRHESSATSGQVFADFVGRHNFPLDEYALISLTFTLPCSNIQLHVLFPASTWVRLKALWNRKPHLKSPRFNEFKISFGHFLTWRRDALVKVKLGINYRIDLSLRVIR